jgi:hypothetical protein
MVRLEHLRSFYTETRKELPRRLIEQCHRTNAVSNVRKGSTAAGLDNRHGNFDHQFSLLAMERAA